MMNKRYVIYFPLIIAISIIAGIFIGNRLNVYPEQTRNASIQGSNKLNTIINIIQGAYVDSVSKSDLIEEAIPALIKNLDPHTAYIPAKNLQDVNEELAGDFGGIGVQFSIYKDTVQIIDVISGGPSSKLGVLPGDRIVSVNDSVIAGNGVENEDVLHLLRGKKGTKVKVGVQRKGIKDLIQFEITRGTIPLLSVDVGYPIDKETGYIRISRFSAKTYDEFMKKMTKLDSLGIDNVIIDLRGNPGGFLQVVLKIAGEFLNKGDILLSTKGRVQPQKSYSNPKDGKWLDKGVYILIDEYSASASEILSGAIQDNDRGVIIGRRSFGKGLVQEQIPFSDGSALRLTVARYYTPSGRCIQKPYKNGMEQYSQDILNRLQHGELEQADSIHFADSLRYETKEGRTVYGGGGIMPDIFVPMDTTEYSMYYSKIVGKSLTYSYTLEYCDKNRKELNKLKTANDFIKYLTNKNILHKFTDYVSSQGIKEDKEGLKISGHLIKTQVIAYITRNMIGDEGFYSVIQGIDKTLQKAIEISKSEESLEEILGENIPKKHIVKK
ncbi:MAG: S41 family peptidase [Prolixibacteraceae bacterium]|nr:S41 family peptidase [Prolixibacteraceae bacterium]